ncbi:MAG: hypothetical protein IJW18_08905 [Lachnospiraceae bacterium]|nr:hypothetical protein [Lachnospiraceae bacterium]
MKEQIIAICDTEKDYAMRLAERIREEEGERYAVRVFTGVRALLEYNNEQPIAYVVLGENLLEELMEKDADAKEIKESLTGTICVLSDKNITEQNGYYALYKYQAASELIRKLFLYIKEEKTVWRKVKDKEDSMRTIAFFSPVHSYEQTLFTVTTGLLMSGTEVSEIETMMASTPGSAETDTLYINLGKYSGFEKLLGIDSCENLSEAMFCLLRDGKMLKEHLPDLIKEAEGFKYLPSIKTATDFEGLGKDMLSKCIGNLKRLAMQGEVKFNRLLIELNGETEGFLNILKLCDRIYLLKREGEPAVLPNELFLKECELLGEQDIIKKIEEIEIPNISNMTEISDVISQKDGSWCREVRKRLIEGGVID